MKVTDSGSRTATKALSIAVSPAPLTISTASLPPVTISANPDPEREPLVVGTRLYDLSVDGGLRAWDTVGSSANRSWQGSVAVSATSGTVRWRRKVSMGSSAVVAGGVLLASADPFDGGSIVAMDTSTGERLWTLEGIGRANLSVAGDLLLARSPYELKGYDRRTGEEVWAGATYANANSQGAATVARGRIYVSVFDDGVRAYGPLD